MQTAVWRGMIRFLVICIDCSERMEAVDLKPTRLRFVTKTVAGFIREYFDQNPLSQLALVATRGGKAEPLSQLTGLRGGLEAQRIGIMSIRSTNQLPMCELSFLLSFSSSSSPVPTLGNSDQQVAALELCMTAGGEPSIQNALVLARTILRSSFTIVQQLTRSSCSTTAGKHPRMPSKKSSSSMAVCEHVTLVTSTQRSLSSRRSVWPLRPSPLLIVPPGCVW